MNRRAFLQTLPTLAVAAAPPAIANKRERMLQWLAGKPEPNYTPAAFFLHFAPEFKNGLPAAKRHMEFFRQTDMDFVKIQFEQTYTRQEFLQKPADWSKLALRKLDFYEPLLVTVRELVKTSKKDSLILMTLYSPFMCAGHCATSPLLLQHLQENPDAVKKGLEILTESQMLFVRACIQAGVDGFYMSTQGSEAKRFASPDTFTKYVKPYDLVSMKEIQSKCVFNILHVCDYVAPYANYDAVYDYPGHVINCNLKLTNKEFPAAEVAKLFKRPFMGGMDRHGIIGKGSTQELESEIRRVIKGAPRQFILAADCTVAGDTDWNRLRQAIRVAHSTGTA
jgi:uroporphyrinogen decarboxylase